MKAKAKLQQAPDGSWFGTVEGTDDDIARFIEFLGRELSKKKPLRSGFPRGNDTGKEK